MRQLEKICQNEKKDKTSNIWQVLSTNSRHYVISAKIRSRVTTAITISRQIDAGLCARTTWYWENLVLVLNSSCLRI